MAVIQHLLRLTRYDENLLFVLVTTLIGARFSGPSSLWRLGLVLIANWLTVFFAFMINDIEDAPSDALNPSKAARNPVSAGRLSRKVAVIASLVVAMLAGAAFYLLGPIPFRLGVCSLALGVLYSWRVVRLKCIPFVDLISHGMLLAGFQLLTAYFGLAPQEGRGWMAPFVFVVSISFYGELFNEVRDLEWDLRAGLTHTAALIGRRASSLLMGVFLALAVALSSYALGVGLVPWWVLAITTGWAALLVGPRVPRRGRHPAPDAAVRLHDAILLTGALTIASWMAIDLVRQ